MKTKTINRKTHSIDGAGIMLGRPAFTDDLADPNALIIKILRSPHAFARVKSINVEKARALPGVELVLTHHDVPHVAFTRAGQGYPEPSPHDKFVLDEYVRYVGDEVACVAAVDGTIAEAALKLIEVEYEVYEPLLDFEKALDHKTRIHPETGIKEMFPIGFDPKRNLAAAYHMEVGNVEQELAKCDVTVKQSFYTQAQAHSMLEPHTANARLDYHNRLVIYSTTQTPFHVRRILSQTLSIPLSQIRVIKPRVGGGFGGKQALHSEMFVALVTMRTRKPSKLVFTRQEVYESSYTRHPMRLDMQIGASKDGVIQAIDCHVLSDTGAYGEHALTVFMVAGSKVLPLYNKVAAVRFCGEVVYTNHVSAGAFRGYGAIQGNYGLESAIDLLAAKLKMDPTILREKNMIGEGQSSPIFAIMGEGTAGTPMIMESCKLDYCLARGKKLIGWDKKYPRVEVNAETVRGVGMALAMQGSGIPHIDMGSASIKLNDDGFYNLTIGATDIGQGSDTVCAAIAAEVLQVPIEKVIVYSSDTDLTPFDTGAYASSTTYISGNAVLKAATKLKAAIMAEAATTLQVGLDEVLFNGERFVAGEKALTLSDLANQLYYNQRQKQLSATASFVGSVAPPPFMAGFVEVEVDKATGEFKILEYVSVVDCGTTLNPMLAKGQVEGGIVQGIGMAAFEEVKYTPKGKLISNSFLNYKIPTALDIGHLTTEFADSYEQTGPFGAKSVGEIGIDTPPAALCNAIEHAVGVRITHLPISPEKILAGIKALAHKE